MLATLEQQTRDYFDVPEDEDNPHTHLDYAMSQLRSGETIASLARKLSGTDESYSRDMLSKYLHSHPDCKERMEEDMPVQTLAMIEEGVMLVDQRPVDKLDAVWAMNKARIRESYAKMRNPAFQPNKGTSVHIGDNIGMLHLQAVDPQRALGTRHAHARIINVDADPSAPEQL